MSVEPAPGTRPTPSVAILGLGLIGGSLARDLAAAGWRVTGWDRDPTAVVTAAAAGVLRKALRTREGEGAPAPDLNGLTAEVVVLAVPVGAAPALLAAIAGGLPTGAVVTDVGSTKRSILAAADALGLGNRFVGGHPMAGDHRSGWGSSRRGLFAGARVWLCPGDRAEPEAVARVMSLWETVGARPARVSAAQHDRRVAWASHLPQAVSSALGAALSDAGVVPDDLGPGGRDATRLAGSHPGVWTDILLDNTDEVRAAIRGMCEALDGIEAALRADDAAGVRAILERAQRWAAAGV